MDELHIKVTQLHKKFTKSSALNGVSFELSGSGIYGLAGPNGSGKTTLLKILAGLLKPTSGEIAVMGEKVTRQSSKFIAFLSEEDSLYEFQTATQIIQFCDKVIPDFSKKKAEEILKSLSMDMSKKVKHMSKGNKSRLKLTIALSRQVPVLLLDEPFSGLDPLVREDLIKLIVSHADVKNQMILLSTHEVSEIEPFLDHIIVMNEGVCVLDENTESLRHKRGQSVMETMKEVLT